MKTPLKTNEYENFVWYDLHQPNEAFLSEFSKTHGMDFHLMRDSLQSGHLPKFEVIGTDYRFLIMRAYTAEVQQRVTTINQISNKIAFFIYPNKIITIRRATYHFIDECQGNFVSPDHLLIYLIRQMLATFQAPAEYLSHRIDLMEKRIFLPKSNRKQIDLEDLYYVRSGARLSKKLLSITQQTLQHLSVEPKSQTALQDVKDLLLGLLLTHDEVNEDANNLLNIYLSVNARNSNEVMKLLTIFSVFFLPLTFIVGIYGMNFENMPELKMQNGYFITLGGMALISILIFLWFKMKRIL